MVIISSPFVGMWYYTFFTELQDVFFMFFALLILICGLFYTVGRFKLLGGGDAIGLIFMSICLPGHPFSPLVGEMGVGVFPIAVIINSCVFGLIMFPFISSIDANVDSEETQTKKRRVIPFMIPVFFSIIFSLIFGDIFTVVTTMMRGFTF
jgi:hypothetical protein